MMVLGFTFSALSAAIKKDTSPDLALIFSEREAVMAGVFTSNAVKAAPVRYDMEKIESSKGQAIIINSGNANACTGSQGLKNAHETARITASELAISSQLVYVASTGVIGEPLPMDKIRANITELVRKRSREGILVVAKAMMTTDTFPKVFSKKIGIEGKEGTIVGLAKGAGMINPFMATMLCFLVTDIAVNSAALKKALIEAVNRSFNRISVDGDMSTNDTVLLMANGMCKNIPVKTHSEYYPTFLRALCEVTDNLARMIVKDGEGATKFIEIIVRGAETEGDAERAARAVAGSNLVKTALYGNDANWGRIFAAIGYSGAKIKEEQTDIYLNDVQVVQRGTGTGNDEKANHALSKGKVDILIDLGIGKGEAEMLTCDLTETYIKINAEYRT